MTPSELRTTIAGSLLTVLLLAGLAALGAVLGFALGGGEGAILGGLALPALSIGVLERWRRSVGSGPH